jgi:2-desacetyl-2-hydroxyethyl bacteriochlorophyllide A dehydrogenase
VFHGKRDVRLEETELPPLRRGKVLVRALFCGVSAGTERLVYTGAIPAGVALDPTISELGMKATYPFPYGYCLVGEVEDEGPHEGESLAGRKVLVLHPHQDKIVVDRSKAILLPEDLDPALATLLPNAETAVNLVLDGAPLIGERAGVLGLGTVGRITTDLLADFPLAVLDAVDPSPYRRLRTEETIGSRSPARAVEKLGDCGYDLIFELSGNPAALGAAVAAAAYDGRIVVGSWYGTKEVKLDLGSDFHRKRIKLMSSQVSTIAPALSGRWNFDRRMELAVAWCRRSSRGAWVSRHVPFSSARAAYELLIDEGAEYSQIVLDMEE